MAIGHTKKYKLLLTLFAEELLSLSNSGGTDIEDSPASSDDQRG
jgi:hypothetical protein